MAQAAHIPLSLRDPALVCLVGTAGRGMARAKVDTLIQQLSEQLSEANMRLWAKLKLLLSGRTYGEGGSGNTSYPFPGGLSPMA